MKTTSINRLLYVALCALCLSARLSGGPVFCSKTRGSVDLETEVVNQRTLCVHSAVVPGQSVKVGFFVQHKADFHSGWKQAGAVRYPLYLEWKSPRLEYAPRGYWDLLELFAMEGHPAHGYSRDVLHDTNVKVTNVLAEGALTINTEVVWLASSKNCFSSTGFFQLRLPVAQYPQISCDSEKLQRESVPELNGWSVSVQFDSVIYQPGLALNKPRHSPTIGIYRYSEDGQATAIFTQTVHDETDRNLFLSIAPVSFGPKDLSDLPCLLYSKNGWEGSAVKYVRSTSPHYEN